MAGKPFKFKRLFLLVALLPLLGCSFFSAISPSRPPVDAQPFVDVNAIRTQAVETNIAYTTLDARLNPSATVSPTRTRRPPTGTPTLTATLPPPTATKFNTPSITPTRTNPPVPTRTLTYYINDQARLYDQNPKDYTVFAPGQDFDITWVVRNTGSKIWTTKYSYEYQDGVKSYRKLKYYLPDDVARLSETKLVVDMIAPKEPGQYTTRWVLVNEQDIRFATFFFTFLVRAK